MKTRIAFGSEGLLLDLPAGRRYRFVEAHAAEPAAEVGDALRAALVSPIASPSLLELAQGSRTAAISVCDITRPAPNRLTLPPMLETLHAAGLRAEDIRLCIATGLHRLATPPELEAILGAEIAARYPIVNHDARARENHVFLGDTKRGTPVWIERAFYEADLHLSLGFIEQHLMLGFSGGRKLVAPGLAGEDTIKRIHSPRFMRESRAVEGSIDENPLHFELLEIAGMVRHDFLLDVTLTKSREISGIFAGEPVAAHAAGVKALRADAAELFDEPVDAAITSAAGRPLDLTFYQVIKGITAISHIVKPGGTILLCGECSEGAGSFEFSEMLAGYAGAQEFLDSIADAPVIPDQWMLEKLALVERTHRVLFYTPGLQRDRMGEIGKRAFSSVDQALAALLSRVPEEGSIAIVPDGPYAFAQMGKGNESLEMSDDK
jgi:nickel-dependent lactate racemase